MPSGKHRVHAVSGRHNDLFRVLPTSHGYCRSPLDPCYSNWIIILQQHNTYLVDRHEIAKIDITDFEWEDQLQLKSNPNTCKYSVVLLSNVRITMYKHVQVSLSMLNQNKVYNYSYLFISKPCGVNIRPNSIVEAILLNVK